MRSPEITSGEPPDSMMSVCSMTMHRGGCSSSIAGGDSHGTRHATLAAFFRRGDNLPGQIDVSSHLVSHAAAHKRFIHSIPCRGCYICMGRGPVLSKLITVIKRWAIARCKWIRGPRTSRTCVSCVLRVLVRLRDRTACQNPKP